MNDRNSTEYQQYLKIAKYEIGGTQYEFYMVHRDGTQITGNTFLENLFDVGGANQYPYLDLIAPDVLGTRTILDVGGHVEEFQTDGGGAVPALGEVHDDYMQRITGQIETRDGGGGGTAESTSGSFSVSDALNGSVGASVSGTRYRYVDFDSADSVIPNPAKTNDDRTAHAAFVSGTPYIVLMQTA